MKQSVFAAIGFGVALLGASVPLAAEPYCEPVAIVDGDPALVTSLQARLIERGIAIDDAASDGCPPLRATIMRQGNVVAVTVVEPSGASVDRSVTTADIAATWIESRVRHDVGAPLLAVRMRPPTIAPGTTAPVAVVDTPPVASAGPVHAPLSMAVWMENGSADDSSSWRAYAASACVRLGPTCVGVLGRVSENAEITHDDGFTFAERDSRDVLLTVAAPLYVGRVTLLPSVAAGVGWMTTRQIDEPLGPPLPEGECVSDPGLPAEYCELPPQLRVTTRGGRLALGVSVSVPLGNSVALELGISNEWLLGAHSTPLRRDVGFFDPADPGRCPPDGDPVMCPDDFIEYPGEPTRLLRVGIGLRVGLP